MKKVREVTKLLFERYLNQFELNEELKRLSHKAIEEIESYPIDKLSRWLGFVQAYVIFTKQTTIDVERDFSRPLFHNAYKNENIEIPPTFSSKNILLTEYNKQSIACKKKYEFETKTSKSNTLLEYDLETNFNGYPFENIAYDLADEITEYFIKNEFTRFHKNKKYKLVLTLEEY